MMADTIWDILGISPTSDKRAIKKAYAAKCAACHPEEHPEEFDRLHKAYTAAVKAADSHPCGHAHYGSCQGTGGHPGGYSHYGSCQGTGGHPRYLPAGGAGHGAGVKRLMQ